MAVASFIESDRPLEPSELTGDARKSAWTTALLVVGLAALSLSLIFFAGRSSPDGAVEDGCAIAILWVAAVPTWRFIVSRRRMTPLLAAICAVYATYYAWPRFSSRPLFGDILWGGGGTVEGVQGALTVALIGLLCLLIGYESTGRFVERAPSITRAIDLKRAMPFLMGCSAVSLAVRLLTMGVDAKVLGQTLAVVQGVGEMAMGGLLLAYLRGELRFGYKLWLVGFMLMQILLGIGSGALALAVWPMAAAFFVYSWERRRFPYRAILIAVLLFFPLQAAKGDFRAKYGGRFESGLSGGNVVNYALIYLSFAERTLTEGDSETFYQSSGRANQLGTLAVVVSQTPAYVPYWGGYTLSDLPWHFIPRFLVPDKPSPAIGQEFPRRYGVLDWQDTVTSYNLPQLVELYANFGNVGVVIGMLLIGTVYRFLDHVLSQSTGGILIAAPLLARMMNIESNISAVFGGLPFLMIAYYLFIRLLPPVPNLANQTVGQAGSASS